MPTVKTLIPSLGAVEAQTAVSQWAYLFILRHPEDGEVEVPQDEVITFRVCELRAVPATEAPKIINCTVEISLDNGETWMGAYSNGSFSAPFDGPDSGVYQSTTLEPYVYNTISIDYTGIYEDSSTVMVRAAASIVGWGYGPWAQQPWGDPSSVAVYQEEWSFVIEDNTPPKLLSAEGINRKTIQLTYDDDMRVLTPDGRARVETGANGAWDLSAGGETLSVVVDGWSTQEIVFQTYMWLDPSAVTDEELAFAISALVVGGVADVNGSGGVYLYSESTGDAAKIQVTGGTANNLFDFPDTVATGTSEGVLQVENYTLERHNVYPAVAVHLTPVSAEFVEGSERKVDILCQWEMTPNAPYSVAVDGDVADTSDNQIDPDYKSAEFAGYVPPWPEDRDAEISMPNSVWDGDPMDVTRATVNMFQEIEDLKITDVDELWDVWNIDKCNDPTIELMLFDAGNPFGDLGLSEDQKRQLVDLLPYIYAQKGLGKGLVSTILALLGIPVTIVGYMANSWRLGVDRLGNDYPTLLWSSNAETYNLSGGGTLIVIIDEGDPQTIEFEDADFDLAATATAKEVAIVINANLTGGGANVFDDGSGPRVEVFSRTWGPDSSIMVSGGTVASIVGFALNERSSGGGCMLGPSTERMMRTFDLEYSAVVPSADEIAKIRKIAIYMKPVNTHLGRIRPAKTAPVGEFWMLGFDYLGVDTILDE